MAELTLFSYDPKRTALHRIDPRFKQVLLMVMTLSGLKGEWLFLAWQSFFLMGLMMEAGLSLFKVMKEIKLFLLFMIFVFAARLFSEPGPTLFSFWVIQISEGGLSAGAMVCWRLFLVVIMGLLLVRSTKPSEMRGAIIWFLAPVPFVDEKKAGTMISLLVRFTPVILNQAEKTLDAQKARGIENRKNPIYRMVCFVIPMLKRVFFSADDLALAMESRCYNENRTGPVLQSSMADWLSLVCVVGVSAIVFYAEYLFTL